MPRDRIDERFRKRLQAVRRGISELSEKNDEELERLIADSGNSFVLEEYGGERSWNRALSGSRAGR